MTKIQARSRKIMAILLFSATFLFNLTPILSAQPNRRASKPAKKDSLTRLIRDKETKFYRVSTATETERAEALKTGKIIEDYGTFAVIATPNEIENAVPLETDVNLPNGKFNPLEDDLRSLRGENPSSNAKDYFIVQFAAPANDKMLETLRETGLEMVQYVPHNAFFVYGKASEMGKAMNLPKVRWGGKYLAEDKISTALRQQIAVAKGEIAANEKYHALEMKGTDRALFDVAVFSRADFAEAKSSVVNAGSAKIVEEMKLQNSWFNLVTVEMPISQVEQIASLPDVVRIDAYAKPEKEDERAAHIVAGNYTSTTTIAAPGYNPLTQFGVDGSNVTVSVVDDGVGIPGDGGFYVTASNSVNANLRGATAGAAGHGHLNASIISGDAPFSLLDPTGYNYGIGVAPKSHIINVPLLRGGYSGNDQLTSEDTVTTAGPNGVRGTMSNNSWGSGTNGNAYDSRAAIYDNLTRDATTAATIDPILVIFSAGNSGTSGLTRPKMAKNVIAVAASENLRTELGGTGANNIDDIAGFSSRGLAADGRIKPDIAAPGTSIAGGRSGTSGLDGNIDTFHRRSSGTSHAAPQVAGAAALFTQFWKNNNGGANPFPSLVKAVILNTGVEMTGVGSSNPLPNGDEGWGRINMKTMLNTGVPMRYVNETIPFSDVGNSTTLTGTVADATKPVRFTLVWTDPPAVADPTLINNLDLTVTIGANVYRGNVFTTGVSTTGGISDTRNNIENIFLPAGIPAGTPISVQINAVALNGDGIIGNADPTDQNFSFVAYNMQSTTTARTQFDFDGDAKADVSVFRASDRVWYLLNSTAGNQGFQFGLANDKIVPADYDGDGKTDIAVFRDGTWYLLRSQLGFTATQWGNAGDIPLPYDFDGDGKADLGVFRNGVWFVLKSSGGVQSVQWGIAGDVPTVGDYDGDGKADYGVFRNGFWYLLNSTTSFQGFQWGTAGDKPVQADYDGDGKTDIGVFRNGTWFILRSQLGAQTFGWGITNDIATPADYDGDGKADFGVFRNGIWYLQRSTSGVQITNFGLTGDKPLPASFQP